MTAIRIHRRIESETLHLPELTPFIGQEVEILVKTETLKPRATEKDWEDFFATADPDLIDSELYQQYRAFDQQQNLPPSL